MLHREIAILWRGICSSMPESTACSALQFVAFASNATGQTLTLDDFWSNELCMQYYKNLVSFWLNHPNSLNNGLQFKASRTESGTHLMPAQAVPTACCFTTLCYGRIPGYQHAGSRCISCCVLQQTVEFSLHA